MTFIVERVALFSWEQVGDSERTVRRHRSSRRDAANELARSWRILHHYTRL